MTGERIYHGVRGAGSDQVTFYRLGERPRPLSLRRDRLNHSQNFKWGYQGSGPAQLAFCLLLHVTQDHQRALTSYQRFKRLVVAHLKGDEWTLTEGYIRYVLEWIERREQVDLSQGIPFLPPDGAGTWR